MGSVFRKALPIIGAVAGTFLGGQTELGYAAGAALGGSLGSAASSALTPTPKLPGLPKPPPLPDEQVLALARRRKAAGGAGRASTIFTDIGDAAGGGSDRLGP